MLPLSFGSKSSVSLSNKETIMKIFGISVFTIALIALAYYLGTKRIIG
ncbi:hypothetical protein [Salmonella phage PKJ.Sj.20.1]